MIVNELNLLDWYVMMMILKFKIVEIFPSKYEFKFFKNILISNKTLSNNIRLKLILRLILHEIKNFVKKYVWSFSLFNND